MSFATRLGNASDKLLVNLPTDDHGRSRKDGRHHLLLEASGYQRYRAGGLDYLLKRSDIDEPEAGSRRGSGVRATPR